MSPPEETYRSRARRFAGEEARLARRSAALSWTRLAAAAAVVFFLFLGLLAAAAPPAWVWLGAGAGAAVFVALALAHDRVIRRQRRWGELAALNEEGLARIARRWDDLPPGPQPVMAWQRAVGGATVADTADREAAIGGAAVGEAADAAAHDAAIGNAAIGNAAVGNAAAGGAAAGDAAAGDAAAGGTAVGEAVGAAGSVATVGEATPPFARDLDLFGRRSLARLLGTARTPVGRAAVAAWLLAPAEPAEVRSRQAAVAELAPRIDFRQRLEAAGLAAGVPVDPREAPPAAGGLAGRAGSLVRPRASRRPPGDLARFYAWAEGEPWLLPRPGLLWAARLLPVAGFALLVTAVAGAVPFSLAALALVVNLVVSWSVAGKLGERFDQVAAGADDLFAYAGTLAVAEEGSFAVPRLQALAAELAWEPNAPHLATGSDGTSAPALASSESLGTSAPVLASSEPLGTSASALASPEPSEGAARKARRRRRTGSTSSRRNAASGALGRLARRVEIADARHGSFHLIIQALLLWDVHALWLLERWQVGAGRRVRRWLAALGELEALAALAVLAHDEPEWTFPRLVEDSPPVLAARALAHPLLAAGTRVANDVTVGPPGSFLLVTGSNMSGKSTLLRALGVNVVLAQAGGPVCAADLELPPVALGTSVIVEDSLGDGVSFFMAELLRLKQVVDLAEAAPAGGRLLLFLLDEVLRGTNNRERREALRRVMAHLMSRRAIGAISTHDLELGDLPEIAGAAVAVHFRETIHPPGSGGPPMSFDYLLRPGPATTTNALRLLEAVGLGGRAPRGAPDEEPGPAP